MKSCLDGYLTPECANCSFWCNGSDLSKGIGCSVPFPIDHCEAFKKMTESEEEVDAVQDSIDMLPYPWTEDKYNEIYDNSEEEK